MAEALTLEVATPNGLALRTEATSVQAPSVSGEFGVLPGHLPVLAALQSGVLRYEAAGKVNFAAIGPGFVEAEPLKVLLLTDLFAVPENIDLAEVEKELVELNARELKSDFNTPEGKEIMRGIAWANARINAKTAADR